MVFVAEVKGCWYVYRSYRLPGHEYPLHEYLGPAADYKHGLGKMVARKLAAMEEKARKVNTVLTFSKNLTTPEGVKNE